MKRRLNAVLLALGLTAACFSACVYAEETEAVTEQVTEAGTDAQSLEEAETAAESAGGEQETQGAEDAGEPATESGDASADIAGQMNEYMKQSIVQLLDQLSGMNDSELQAIVDEGDASSALIAANWLSVKEDLGSFVEVIDQQVETEGSVMRAVSTVKYDGVDDDTTVTVNYEVDQAASTFSVEWDIKYPMGTLMKQAALNTVMGLGIVFLTLLFLSILIGKLHIIPDMIENRMSRKKTGPSPAPAAAPAPVSAAPAKKAAASHKKKEHTDDLELVAVIAAAIAASENTSTDSFVVRSIRKVNKKNWQNA